MGIGKTCVCVCVCGMARHGVAWHGDKALFTFARAGAQTTSTRAEEGEGHLYPARRIRAATQLQAGVDTSPTFQFSAVSCFLHRLTNRNPASRAGPARLPLALQGSSAPSPHTLPYERDIPNARYHYFDQTKLKW